MVDCMADAKEEICTSIPLKICIHALMSLSKFYLQLTGSSPVWNRRPPHGIDQPIPNQPITVFPSQSTGVLLARPDEDGAAFKELSPHLHMTKNHDFSPLLVLS
eukprot:UN05352